MLNDGSDPMPAGIEVSSTHVIRNGRSCQALLSECAAGDTVVVPIHNDTVYSDSINSCKIAARTKLEKATSILSGGTISLAQDGQCDEDINNPLCPSGTDTFDCCGDTTVGDRTLKGRYPCPVDSCYVTKSKLRVSLAKNGVCDEHFGACPRGSDTTDCCLNTSGYPCTHMQTAARSVTAVIHSTQQAYVSVGWPIRHNVEGRFERHPAEVTRDGFSCAARGGLAVQLVAKPKSEWLLDKLKWVHGKLGGNKTLYARNDSAVATTVAIVLDVARLAETKLTDFRDSSDCADIATASEATKAMCSKNNKDGAAYMFGLIMEAVHSDDEVSDARRGPVVEFREVAQVSAEAANLQVNQLQPLMKMAVALGIRQRKTTDIIKVTSRIVSTTAQNVNVSESTTHVGPLVSMVTSLASAVTSMSALAKAADAAHELTYTTSEFLSVMFPVRNASAAFHSSMDQTTSLFNSLYAAVHLLLCNRTADTQVPVCTRGAQIIDPTARSINAVMSMAERFGELISGIAGNSSDTTDVSSLVLSAAFDVGLGDRTTSELVAAVMALEAVAGNTSELKVLESLYHAACNERICHPWRKFGSHPTYTELINAAITIGDEASTSLVMLDYHDPQFAVLRLITTMIDIKHNSRAAGTLCGIVHERSVHGWTRVSWLSRVIADVMAEPNAVLAVQTLVRLEQSLGGHTPHSHNYTDDQLLHLLSSVAKRSMSILPVSVTSMKWQSPSEQRVLTSLAKLVALTIDATNTHASKSTQILDVLAKTHALQVSAMKGTWPALIAVRDSLGLEAGQEPRGKTDMDDIAKLLHRVTSTISSSLAAPRRVNTTRHHFLAISLQVLSAYDAAVAAKLGPDSSSSTVQFVNTLTDVEEAVHLAAPFIIPMLVDVHNMIKHGTNPAVNMATLARGGVDSIASFLDDLQNLYGALQAMNASIANRPDMQRRLLLGIAAAADSRGYRGRTATSQHIVAIVLRVSNIERDRSVEWMLEYADAWLTPSTVNAVSGALGVAGAAVDSLFATLDSEVAETLPYFDRMSALVKWADETLFKPFSLIGGTNIAGEDFASDVKANDPIVALLISLPFWV
eukprot:COSAG01_NODE_5288_length_4355_cov_8.270207_2_plen_1084_part_00